MNTRMILNIILIIYIISPIDFLSGVQLDDLLAVAALIYKNLPDNNSEQ